MKIRKDLGAMACSELEIYVGLKTGDVRSMTVYGSDSSPWEVPKHKAGDVFADFAVTLTPEQLARVQP